MAAFKAAWLAFKDQIGPEGLALTYETQDNARSKGESS